MPRPLFFTFDGIDGTGKSTQSQLFCGWLRELGYAVVTCRDPGTTDLGERLREIVLRGEQLNIGARCETLIYMAARAQLVDELIRPALEAGQVVVSDRFLLANVVYQAYGLGLEPDDVWRLGEFATGGIQPAQTFLLDLDVTVAADRLRATRDRMEKRGADYFTRVRSGFLAEARRFPDDISVIDASPPEAEVQARVRAVAAPLLKSR